MKIIHCADLHIGSNISSFSYEYNKKKKIQLLSTFSDLCDYASRNNISYVMMSGDVFDKDRVAMSDYKDFLAIIKKHANITFFYLRGNHDLESSLDIVDNVKTFNSSWTSYDLGDVVISGIEVTEDNKDNLYSSLKLDENRKNIVMIHGDIAKGDKLYNLNKNGFKNKNIDYLALGHIHSYLKENLDDRAVLVYPGCLEGRDFGEANEKGFVLLDIREQISFDFISFSRMPLYELNIDITGLENSYDVSRLIKDKVEINDISYYRIHLIGEIKEESSIDKEDVEAYFSLKNVEIVNDATLKIDVEKYITDPSIKGEFVRSVLKDESLKDDEKTTIISIGLQAFTTKGADIKWK